MKRRQFISLPLPVLFLTLTSTVLASNTWYGDGVNGNDTNDCQTALTACKTIGHAISLAASGDSIVVAAATWGSYIGAPGPVFTMEGIFRSPPALSPKIRSLSTAVAAARLLVGASTTPKEPS